MRLLLLAVAAALALVASASAAPPALSPSVVGEPPNGGGVFRFVQAVAFSPGGATVFAGDQYGGIVQAFGRDGSYRFSVGSRAARREPGRLGIVGGLATDRSGHLYVLDSENDRVQVFSAADGAPLSSFGDASVFNLVANDPAIGAGISASGLTVDQRTASSPPVVYVADQGRNRVTRLTLDLGTLMPVGAPAFSDPSLGLRAPQGIALDPQGTRVYVADDQNDRVVVLDPQTLALVGQVGSSGVGPGQFQAPYDVAVDSHQPPQLYVGDNLNNRVDVFDAYDLGFLRIIGGLGRTAGLFSIVRAVGALNDDPRGGVAVADTANNRVQLFDPDGNITATWGIAGRSPGYVTRPRGLAFAPDGRGIAIADSFNHRIERFEADGTFGGQLGLISSFTGYASEGSADGQLSLPSAVAYDTAGNSVVADTGNDRVVVIGPDGAVLRTTAAGQILDPLAVVAGPAGSAFVADSGHSRVVSIAADATVTERRGGLSHPSALAWDGAAKLFAADDTRVLDAMTGAVVPPPTGAAWDHPSGLAVDPATGTLYVAEQRPRTAGGARVLRGTPAGGGTYSWDTIANEGAGAAQVIQPGGLALSPDGGTLLVADYGNNRVLRFDAPGHAPPSTVKLSVAIDGITRGTVRSDPLGIACATDCVQHYGAGRAVTLTAAAIPGSRFAGWSGACAGATSGPTCTLAMVSEQTVGALFVAIPPPPAVPPPAPPPPPTPAVTLTGLRIVPSTLHRARRADRRHHRRARRATRARVSVTLSRPAMITATVAIGRPGVRRGSQCVAVPRKPARGARRCTRFVRLSGARKLKLASGHRGFSLTPVFAGRTLRAGRYRLALVALDGDGNRIGPVSAGFRVLR